MICFKEKCHCLAFHLRKDLIMPQGSDFFRCRKHFLCSYIPGFLIVLQLLGSLHIQYSWRWRDGLYHQYWRGANFLKGSALLSVHGPPMTGTCDCSCSRDPKESWNILRSCFEMALWTLLRKSQDAFWVSTVIQRLGWT